MLYTNVVQDARSPASLYKNQATGGFSNQRDPIIDTDAMYAHYFETWGRKVEYEFVLGSGADETAQRADAVAVAAKKPFAVFDAAIQGGNQSTGGLIFETEVQARGVPLVLGTGGAPPQSPKEVSKGVARERCRVRGQVARRQEGRVRRRRREGQDPQLRHPLPGRHRRLRHRLLQAAVHQERRQDSPRRPRSRSRPAPRRPTRRRSPASRCPR